MSSANVVGKRIKSIRESRQLSIEELAGAIPGEKSVNARLVESLEQGSLVPSLTPLLQIARALGVRLGSFLDDQAGQDLVHARAGEPAGITRFVGSNLGVGKPELNFHSLAANKNDRHMEPFLIDVLPHDGEPTLSTHEGEEFIYVIEGEIELALTPPNFLTLSHKRQDFLKNVVECKMCVLIFSTTFI